VNFESRESEMFCERNADHQILAGNHERTTESSGRGFGLTVESCEKDGLLEEDDDAVTGTETRTISCLP
jgi:hypothetical protein